MVQQVAVKVGDSSDLDRSHGGITNEGIVRPWFRVSKHKKVRMAAAMAKMRARKAKRARR